jgi:hypothetical protein
MFDAFWPQLEAQLTDIKNRPKPKTHPRPQRELLEEMLEILRSQEQRVRTEREEKEAIQNWSNYLRSIVPKKEDAVNADDAVVGNAVRFYLDALKSSEKKRAIKRGSAPTEPSKKESSNVESGEE